MAGRHLQILAIAAFLFACDAVAAERTSPGCGREASNHPELVHVDGQLRFADVAVPATYEADRGYALFFAFHGRTNDHARARRYFDLETPPLEPAIFVYPAGLRDESGNFTWWRQGEAPEDLRDFAFFDRLLASLIARFCIDLDAIHVVGHSLGASFANSLACARGHVVRSVISVAGGINPATCSGEVAAMLIHNPRDDAVPISEGERARRVLLGGTDDGMTGTAARIGPFHCTRHRDGPNPLAWCPHHQDVTPRGRYYPHLWPSDMDQAISAFLERPG